MDQSFQTRLIILSIGHILYHTVYSIVSISSGTEPTPARPRVAVLELLQQQTRTKYPGVDFKPATSPDIYFTVSSFFFYTCPPGYSTFFSPPFTLTQVYYLFLAARLSKLPTDRAGHSQRQRVLARDICTVPLSCAYPVVQLANKQSASRKFSEDKSLEGGHPQSRLVPASCPSTHPDPIFSVFYPNVEAFTAMIQSQN